MKEKIVVLIRLLRPEPPLTTEEVSLALKLTKHKRLTEQLIRIKHIECGLQSEKAGPMVAFSLV